MRSEDSIIKDLKRLWGEDWETNLSIIGSSPESKDIIPLKTIERSNNLIWELNAIRVRRRMKNEGRINAI